MNQTLLYQAQCENELQSLNTSYIAMLDLLEMMVTSQQPTFAEDRFTNQLAEISDLQAQIESQELQLTRIQGEGVAQSPAIARLTEERKSLIEALITRNQSVTLQARAIQSYLLDELHQTSAGYVALKGYKSSDSDRSQGLIRKSV